MQRRLLVGVALIMAGCVVYEPMVVQPISASYDRRMGRQESGKRRRARRAARCLRRRFYIIATAPT